MVQKSPSLDFMDVGRLCKTTHFQATEMETSVHSHSEKI